MYYGIEKALIGDDEEAYIGLGEYKKKEKKKKKKKSVCSLDITGIFQAGGIFLPLAWPLPSLLTRVCTASLLLILTC